ncbi:unnamed protein product [Choristocarpus tenellus]
MEVTDQMVEAALVSTKQPYRLVPVRFVEEGGTKLGHTVTINWEAKVDGTAVPGGKGENFLLDLKEDQEEPWVTFSRKIAVGMGQMETKVFPASFPMSFEVSSLQGKTALVTVVVKNIARKEEKPPETRSDDEIRTFLREKAKETFKMRTDQFVDEAVKQQLLKICEVDADKVSPLVVEVLNFKEKEMLIVDKNVDTFCQDANYLDYGLVCTFTSRHVFCRCTWKGSVNAFYFFCGGYHQVSAVNL